MLILVAEDDEALRLLLTEFFEGLGHTVKSAENGVELVKIALAGRPDADFGHAEGCLGLMARGSSVHAEAHRSEATLSC